MVKKDIFELVNKNGDRIGGTKGKRPKHVMSKSTTDDAVKNHVQKLNYTFRYKYSFHEDMEEMMDIVGEIRFAMGEEKKDLGENRCIVEVYGMDEGDNYYVGDLMGSCSLPAEENDGEVRNLRPLEIDDVEETMNLGESNMKDIIEDILKTKKSRSNELSTSSAIEDISDLDRIFITKTERYIDFLTSFDELGDDEKGVILLRLMDALEIDELSPTIKRKMKDLL